MHMSVYLAGDDMFTEFVLWVEKAGLLRGSVSLGSGPD